MMCHKMGRPPISIIGLGFRWVSSEIRVPRPPARITAFISESDSSFENFIFYVKKFTNTYESIKAAYSTKTLSTCP